MRGKITTIAVDGTETVKEYSAAIPLADMQNGVGGYIQLVPYFERFRGERCIAVCNEEGKLRRLPMNTKATTHWRENIRTDDFLTGPVLIVTGDDDFLNEF